MDRVASPDVPAWWCYLVVLAFGMWVAMATVNRLLADQRGYWAYLNTWLLFSAHALIPVLVFAFLDYTTALKDTSLFAALVVAIGYQQIFAGGVQGIVMPGETSRLWKPFESWVQAIAKKIATSTKRARDEFEAGVKSFIASEPQRVQALYSLAVEYSIDGQQLETDLQQIENAALPHGIQQDDFSGIINRRKVGRMVDDLRASMPLNFGDLLRDRGLVRRWDYWRWFRGLKSRTVASIAAAVILILVALGLRWFLSDTMQLRYHQWRFLKANASDQDHHRSREYLGSRLRTLTKQGASEATVTDIATTLRPITAELRFKGLSAQSAEEIERLLIDFHSTAVDNFAIPELIDALKNENSDIRLHVCETLIALRDADFADASLPQPLNEWIPKKGDSPAVVASYVAKWNAWWKSVSR